MTTIIDGIVIGAVGGLLAGVSIWSVQYLREKVTQAIETNRVYNWLNENTTSEPDEGDQFKTTRAIASWNNLTEDRVRYICSLDNRIFLSTGERDNMWGIYDRVERSVYDKRGLQSF